MPNGIYNINQLIQPKVLPPLPPYAQDTPVQLSKADGLQVDDTQVLKSQVKDKTEVTLFGTPQVVPISIKKQSETAFWLLPTECLLSIGAKNILVKRNVAKKKNGGTIKEYWTRGDYTINISGVMTNPGYGDYPHENIITLHNYCIAAEALDVNCPALERLNIKRIVIEGLELPFTKGPENQNFTITAVSDDDWNLLIETTHVS